MSTRRLGVQDRLIGEIDKIIKTLTLPPRASRDVPETTPGEVLPEAERAESVRLMRVNHAGEVAAQALYQGQALTARDPKVESAMHEAAAEEIDHLAWCEERLKELKGRPSLLNPLWYVGSLSIGALAGALGDRASLGFISGSRKQVLCALRDHLGCLSPDGL